MPPCRIEPRTGGEVTGAGFAVLLDTIKPETTTSDAIAPLTRAALTDPFGRDISYLRISVTDRCDFRCVYCMSEDMTFLPKRDLLTLEEIDRVASAFVARGTRKLRLTAASRWSGAT